MLINENRWRAQRYGIDEGLVDFGKGEIVPYAELLDEMHRRWCARTPQLFGCVAEIAHARKSSRAAPAPTASGIAAADCAPRGARD